MTIAPPSYQPLLLEVEPRWRITKNAQARNAYGTVAQHLVCAVLGLRPIPINGNYDVCFDALGEDGTYYEVKSVRARGGKVVVYDWRMAKEAGAGVAVCYAILLHGVRGSDGGNLVRDFVRGGLEVVVLPAEVVHGVAMREPLRKLMTLPLDHRAGYNRAGYKEGYRNVPVAALRALCTRERLVEATYAGHGLRVKVWEMDEGKVLPGGGV